MHYRLFISEKARQQLRALEKSIRRNIGYRMEFLRDDLKGDVKKLEAKGNSYRLRIGSHRVLFTLEGDQIAVYAVRDRKEAYE
ncbi:MAG: type II toxin-antitoxin system RelE/ParE family toxin [Terrimicrobiaceae bacterium]